MESIEHYKKFIESITKLLHRENKKTDEIIESKQITEIDIKDCSQQSWTRSKS